MFSTITKILFASLLLFAGISEAATVVLAWDRPADARVVGFKIYVQRADTMVEYSLAAGNVTQAEVSNLLNDVRYNFTVTSVDSTGTLESNRSNMVSTVVPSPVCSPLTGTTENRAGTCPAGYSGSTVESRTMGAAPTCAWTPWTVTTNNCVLIPVACNPVTGTVETRNVACPVGQTGNIVESRTMGVTPGCVWSNWTVSSNTCVTPQPAAISVNVTSLDMGVMTLKVPSAAKSIIVTNTGGSPLLLSKIKVAGQYYDFAQKDSTCQLNVPVVPGGTCIINYFFRPLDVGLRTLTATIESNASNTAPTVTLRGTGRGFAMTPEKIDFGTVVRGQYPTRNVVIKNVWNKPFIITNIQIGGSAFQVTGDCQIGASMAPNQTCQFTVKMASATVGNKGGSVTITSDVAGTGRVLFSATVQ
jgi:hypothetical protein